MKQERATIPEFNVYGDYSQTNYGTHTLVFTDPMGNDFYFSYRTLVAFRTPDTGLVVHENNWSQTTGKHLNWIDGGGTKKKDRLSGGEFKALFNKTFGE